MPKVQAASASTADLLLDFQFNEGEGLTSRSSVGDVTVSLGTEIYPASTPTGVLEAPSGLPNDRAALFDGNGWLYGEYSAEPIDLTQPLTWEGWIYVDKDSTKTVQNYFNLGETLKVGVSSEHNFMFTFRGVEDVFSNIMVQADEISGSYWTHLACSWDPTGGSTLGTGVVRFYQDGILRQEVDTASRFRAYQANILSVGASNSGDSLFQGMMDRVRLHKALLTDAQLDSDAANPKPITANTVIAYEFNEETVPFLSATSPALPLEDGIVADTFTLGGLKYTVLTEEPASKTGTVSVKRESTETSGDIVIPSSVTNEEISYSVVLIPKGAFSECSGLTSIIIPDSVTSLGRAAFFDCDSLTNATIGNSVTVIGDSTFSTCNNLKSVIIGNSVTSIERAAFYESTSLTNVTIGNSVTAIGSDAFAFSGLTSIIIPESVTSIGGYAFNGCRSLTSVYFRGDSPNVGNGFFEGCGNLKTIYYFEGKSGWTNPWNGIETVAVGAEEVIIVEQPQSQLILPGEKAILKATVFSAAALNYQWYKNGVAIEGSTNSTYVIPIFSFSDNGNYTVKVSTPSQSVTSEPASLTVCTAADQFDYTIEGEKVIINGYLGAAAVVVIPPTIEDKPVQTIGAFAFSPNDEYPGRVNLAKVLMPDTVTDAGINAFGFCSSLTNIVLSPNLATLSNRLLEGTAIESITIPRGTISMQAGAFHGCENLKNVFIEEGNPSYIAVDNVVFTKDLTTLVYYPAGIITERYDVPTSVTTLAPESFDGTKIEYLSIPESVTTLEGSVFSYGQFGYIEFPESITSFPNGLFLHCSGVSRGLVIPASVTSIGENCFYYTSITKFYFEGNPPSEVAEIAFPGTSGQAVIYVRSENAGNWPDTWHGMPVIETNVFPLDYDYSIENNGIIINAYNRDDTELEIPETMFGYSVVGLAADVCNGEENIVSIIVPATVTQIGDRAFANCASLKSVFFLGNAPEIGTDLFLNTFATVYYQKGTEGWSENWAGVTTVPAPVVTRNIERDGNIATVTLSIETAEGVSAVFVEETIRCEDPFTVTPQEGGVFNTQTSTIRWAFLSGDSREVTYTLSVAEDCKKILALRGKATFSMDVAWENETLGENEIDFSLPPPAITKQPEATTVGVGVKIKLDVFAQGDEPLTYQWYKDGDAIEDATESAYAINSTVLEDSGSYTVSVRNRNGHVVSNAAVVEIVEPSAYGEATRSIVRARGNKAIVTLKITPTENISAYFVEEQLPNETTVIVSDISNQGAYNEELNKIRWAFLDGNIRTISYMIALPIDYRSVANWYGETIFDVMPIKITGMENCDFSIPFPEIVTQPQSMSVDFRNSVSFTVVATGGENLSYQWFFNKEAIIGATAPVYSIESVLPDNAGLYSVEVSNEAGTVTSQEVSLTLLLPRITKEPLSMTVNEKESFNCSVTAEGSYLSYQWYFNGTLIEGAINSSYSIASVRAANVGDYVVIVSNGAGSVTSQVAHLDVMPMLPPTLVTNPTSITVYEGDNAEFSVVAEGQELTYQWYFNETLIEGATDSKIVITEVVEQDAGSYTVAVSNEKGTVTSQPANLNVILFHPADTNKNWEISSLEIAYYVRQWVSGVVNDILTVAKGVQIWQSGGFYHYDYRNQKPYCWIIGVGDPVNPAASENMSVSLASSLEVTRDVVFTEDGKINVTVHVSNLPESFFTALEERWVGTGMASGVEITDIAEDGVASVLDDDTIAIRWAVIGEFPETFSYTLAIKDGVHGELVPTGTLTITDLSSMDQYDIAGEDIPTNIMVQPESATIEVGDPAVTFGVAVIGTGYDYQWYRFGSPIPEATDINYSTDKGGEYVVTVSKEGDSVTSHVATLIVDTIPEFIAQPQNQTVIVGESVELSGIAYGTAPLTYQWYKNGTLIEGATADTLYLEHVTIIDAGNYTLMVTNELGSVTSSPAVITINQATPVITWAKPAVITYGTTLSAVQLNATANVEGSFAYTPAAGTKLNAGTHQLSVNFTPTDAVNYTSASKTVEIVVNKAASVITWTTPAPITYGTTLSATQLNATANVEGSFAYSPAAGTKLNAGTHQLSVNFTPTDAVNYTSASKTVEIVVNKATPVITWATPAAITYGTTLSATQLNAAANVEGSFAYTPAAGTKLEEGTHTLSVTFTPTDIVNYNTATAEVQLVVKADLPPALSYDLKDGKLTLTYSGGKLEVSDDLVHWIIVDEDGEFEVTIGSEKKKFYRVAK
ncbi:MAG: leucine-rich repeat protein [Verrucomicrobia bacterium]|nr:leucine-rich repeat protein [Verrucomicrobiota bacterium]